MQCVKCTYGSFTTTRREKNTFAYLIMLRIASSHLKAVQLTFQFIIYAYRFKSLSTFFFYDEILANTQYLHHHHHDTNNRIFFFFCIFTIWKVFSFHTWCLQLFFLTKLSFILINIQWLLKTLQHLIFLIMSLAG